MNKHIFKKEKGITLVALVVTIVVLLILAGVSINMVLGNNGLITKAKDAKTKTEQDQVNTEKGMNNLYDEMMSILGENGGSESGGTGDGNEGGTGDEGDGDGDTVDLTGLAIGDLVNYTYDTVADGYSLFATQSGYSSDQTVAQSSTRLKWRILNIDEENGTIDLVSSEPSDNTVYFKGALGYNNGVYLLNDMCAKLYSNSSRGITARSINLADTEKHLTATGLAARNAYNNGTATYGTTKTYTGSNAYYPNLYASQPGAGINLAEGATVTQPDLSGVDPYNESSEVYTTPTTETYSQATQGTGLTVTQTAYYNITFNETNYGAAGAVLNSSNYYWVASRSAGCNSSYAYFGLRIASSGVSSYGLFDSYNNSYYNNNRLRPVVSLSSDLLDGTKDASGAWNLVSAQ